MNISSSTKLITAVEKYKSIFGVLIMQRSLFIKMYDSKAMISRITSSLMKLYKLFMLGTSKPFLFCMQYHNFQGSVPRRMTNTPLNKMNCGFVTLKKNIQFSTSTIKNPTIAYGPSNRLKMGTVENSTGMVSLGMKKLLITMITKVNAMENTVMNLRDLKSSLII